MIPQAGINIDYLRAAVKRRFWALLLPFFTVFVATGVYCVRAPRIYESSTVILIQPQEVPSSYVRSTVTSNASSRLDTLRQHVMSRPRLEALILKHGLYPDVRKGKSMFDAVLVMRDNIKVKITSAQGPRDARDAAQAFEISFQGENPVTVRDVTASIASFYIEDDLMLREQQATGTSQFLDREMQRMKEDLQKREELSRQFKENYVGMLPEQAENNYRILAQLQQHLDVLNGTIQQAEDRKVVLEGRLGQLQALNPAPTSPAAVPAPTPPESVAAQPGTSELDMQRKELAALRARYSEKHPDILRLAATIAKLEQEQKAVSQNPTPISAVRPIQQAFRGQDDLQQRQAASQREELLTQIKLTQNEIQNLLQEKRQTAAQIEEYKGRLESGPKIEERFVDLRRGYEEANANYQSLLQKKLDAELAENLERTRKGEQFRILDPPRMPEKPISPNVIRSLILGFVFALAAGIGLAFTREALDSTYWDVKELTLAVNLPILACAPIVKTSRDERLGAIRRSITIGVVVCMVLTATYILLLLAGMEPKYLLST